jgi:hypothetical protein
MKMGAHSTLTRNAWKHIISHIRHGIIGTNTFVYFNLHIIHHHVKSRLAGHNGSGNATVKVASKSQMLMRVVSDLTCAEDTFLQMAVSKKH